MKLQWLAAASALTLGAVDAPAAAQSMAGMTMPMPEKKKPAKTKASPKKKKKGMARKAGVSTKAPAKPTQGMSMPMEQGAAQSATQPMTMPTDQSQMGHSQTGQMPMNGMAMGEHADHQLEMTGALGRRYPMERESSGTAWQPDSSGHMGLHLMSGDWMLMAHGVVKFVYDRQSGPRGDDKAFASGMLMGMARRPLGQGTLQLKTMLSPDPLMGPSGYPLLLASGETANGRDRLIDRQHPHDLFMELSASVSQDMGRKGSVFVYAGLPGEPAFGPPAFMHRESIMDSPEAPISHHWLDSTHISFGVVTAGVVLDRVKLEISRFNGREPDQHRWNIETGPLDSSSVRVSWNPTRTLALQGSWGHFVSPEQLEPGVNQRRWSASALWADDIALGWKLAGALAWGRKSNQGHNDDAVAAEASLKHADWTLFGRGEMIENRELTNIENDPAYRVGKVSLGMVRDLPVAEHLSLGAGGLLAINFVPDALAPAYGGHNPIGTMAFIRLKLD